MRGSNGRRRNRVHGEPEPGYPLTMASAGECVRVVSLTAETASGSRLVSMGINPGALLHVLSSSGGPIVVARDETRYGIDRKTAWHIRVAPASASERVAFGSDLCKGDCRGCSYRSGMNGGEGDGPIALDSLPPGTSATVLRVRGAGGRPRRLEEAGIRTGSKLTLVGRRPGGDGFVVRLGEDEIAISEWDAFHVLVEEGT